MDKSTSFVKKVTLVFLSGVMAVIILVLMGYLDVSNVQRIFWGAMAFPFLWALIFYCVRDSGFIETVL